ncbi:PWWP domain-containing protein 1-like isoform X2 [Mercurialis annua]|uniref:PWWP domain-containing protein 1-like isoform X2 n=1 Tax=Mercurialis annua TaxID=3986 RepID=UPI00215EB109|nr:PWWP domain-containing protein 1-like isoform X2 [Mercurialis annua]
MKKSEGELRDAKSDETIEENQTKPRVSGDGMESEAISRVLGNNGSTRNVIEVMDSDNEEEEEDEEEESARVFEVKNEKKTPLSFVQFDSKNNRFDDDNDEVDDSKNDVKMRHSRGGKSKGEVYNSLLSEFDDFVANEKHEATEGTSRALSYGFEVGDMVWGKVKSHPWWPGHIFNEAFATSSVRRTRREGYVLVAFFGDSSYGWFDPAELVPFDPHFAEKSQQLVSRTFVKAVEEAVDEASRRCGLGLACRCRNKYNFRPTDAQGYFEVDVPDYEARGFYSENQIKKAQQSFQPYETLSFIKQLASAPIERDMKTIDFSKNKATVFAFRKAVFEEFDETYAQAFGAPSKRSANDPANVHSPPVKVPTRAPLSGPLVIAEALGGGKSSKKAVKVKDLSKKDRYLIKRRDEPVDSRTIQIGQTQASFPAPAASEEGSSVVTGDFVLQKRAPPPNLASNEHSKTNSDEAGEQSPEFAAKALISDQGTALDVNSAHNMEKGALQETKDNLVPDIILEPSKGQTDISLKGVSSPSVQQECEAMVDVRYEESASMSRFNEVSLQRESFCPRAEGDGGFDKPQETHLNSHLSPLDTKHSTGSSTDVKVKKAKAPKRPLGDPGSEGSSIKAKKKKKKKDSSSEASPDRPKKRLAKGTGGALVENVMGKDDHRAHQKKDVAASNASFGDAGTLPMFGVGNFEFDFPLILSDLHALAVDHFHGSGRSSPSTTMNFLLQYRASVYHFSESSSPPPETESTEDRATKSPSSVGVSNLSAGENIRDLPPSKPIKPTVSDDSTKSGRKRLPSDRQEEIAAKRVKKINQMKSLAAEKKIGQKSLETRPTEGKEPVAPQKPVKAGSIRRLESQPKAVQPTMLVMKFPPETSLPSANNLKAKFARFGSIDQSAIRVFWQTSTCRVVFRYKLDAQAAYKYAVSNNALFGVDHVRYSLREVGGPASDLQDSDRGGRVDETSLEVSRQKDFAIERPPLAQQPNQQTNLQLKSILKKPTGDEAGLPTGGGNGGRGAARVKFLLGGEESSSRNFNNSASYAEGGGAPTSVAMDLNSNKFQKVIPTTSLPILPLPPQFAKHPLNNVHHTEVVAPRNMHNLNHPPPPVAPPPPSAASIDISQQMLSLLTRCNDVVASVSGFLGYAPYHPL